MAPAPATVNAAPPVSPRRWTGTPRPAAAAITASGTAVAST